MAGKQNQTLSKRFADYRRNAATRGLVFNLSKDEFDTITQGECVFCGTSDYIGVDRKDSSMGYIEGNVQSCCTFCNKLKSNFGGEMFLEQVARIASFKQLV